MATLRRRTHRQVQTPALGLVILLMLLAHAPASADTGVRWIPGPALTSQNASYAPVLLSDSRVLLLAKNAADGTGKTLDIFLSSDFGGVVLPVLSSPNTGLSSAIPAVLSAIQIPSAGLLLAAGAGGTPATSFLRGANFSWAFPSVTISPGGLTNTTAHSLVMQGGTILSLLQTSAGGYICRSTNNAANFVCVQPGGFGAVAAPTAAGGLGTLEGITSPIAGTWLALDNANRVWRSTNDGASWGSVTQLSVNTSTNALVCVSTSICLAMVSSAAASQLQLFRSINGGATWNTMLTLGRADRLTSLLNVGQGVILALGDPTQTTLPYGYRSSDFGQTWTAIPPASIATPLVAASFIAHIAVLANSVGSAISITNFCTGGGTCNTLVTQSPIYVDPPQILIAGQGSAAQQNNRWPVLITDGTNPLGTASNPLIVGPQRSSTITPLADVSVGAVATLVRAANPARITLLCTNTDPTVPVRMGDATVTATKGVRVPGGTSVGIGGTYAVYMFSEGAAVNMSCSEEAS